MAILFNMRPATSCRHPHALWCRGQSFKILIMTDLRNRLAYTHMYYGARLRANAVGEICIYIKNKQQGVRESRPEARNQKPESGNTMTAPATCGVIKDTSPTGHGPICNQPTRPTTHRLTPTAHQATTPAFRATHRKTIALNQNWFRGPDFNYISYIREAKTCRAEGKRGSHKNDFVLIAITPPIFLANPPPPAAPPTPLFGDVASALLEGCSTPENRRTTQVLPIVCSYFVRRQPPRNWHHNPQKLFDFIACRKMKMENFSSLLE